MGMTRQDQRLYQDVGRALGLLEGLDGKLADLHKDLKDHMHEEGARLSAMEGRIDKNELAIQSIGMKITLLVSVISTVAVTGMDWLKKHVLNL